MRILLKSRTTTPDAMRVNRSRIARVVTFGVLGVVATATGLTCADHQSAPTGQPSAPHGPCVYQIKQTTADYFVMRDETWQVAGVYRSRRTQHVVGFDLPTRPGFVCMLTTDRLVNI